MPTTKNRRATKSGRFYDIDPKDIPYISVTNVGDVVNKPALVGWSARVERQMALETFADFMYDKNRLDALPVDRAVFIKQIDELIGKEKASKRELEKAANIGTQIHALIEWTNRRTLGLSVGERPQVKDEAEWGFMAYEDKAKELELEPMHVEHVVFSRKHKYAGTLDLIARIKIDNKRRVAVTDFKSGKAIYDETKMQLAAYFNAVIEMGIAAPDTAIVIRLPKIIGDPDPEIMEIDNLNEHFEAFLNAMYLRKWQIKQEESWGETK